MRCSNDVKDKNIRMEGGKYRARVEYYDGRIINCGLFDTLVLAQKELAKFPRDVWEDYDTSDFRYKEPDERNEKRNRKRRQALGTSDGEPGPLESPEELFGRSLIRHRC